MIRGTAAQFKFKLPYSMGEIDWIIIEFWQSHNPNKLLPIIKTKNECSQTQNKNEISVSLTAEETAKFSDKYKARFQLRAQPVFGAPFGCRERLIPVYSMSDDIIDDPTVTPPIPPEEEELFIFDSGIVIEVPGEGKQTTLDGGSIVN